MRNIWWVAVFFLVLAAITFPAILLCQQYQFELTIWHQTVIVIAASLICQLWRREPLRDLLGAFNQRWVKQLFTGFIIGAALMCTPALFLMVFSSVHLVVQPIGLSSILAVTVFFVGVAVAEELLFRGFVFQRLISSTGLWPAQLIMGGLFLLTHLNNPGMTGNVRWLAGINIFLASIMFGLAFIRTRSLSMPIGLHFMANWVQGVLLGFGVSGKEQASLMKPIFNVAPDWVTGCSFGLEASVPGLICVVLIIIFLYRWKQDNYNYSNLTK